MKINILRAAQTDLDNGYIFYESREEGLGEHFLRSLHKDMLSLKSIAGAHQIVSGYFRKYASRFPYAIYYKIEETEIRIYAIIDTRRGPEWINNRFN